MLKRRVRLNKLREGKLYRPAGENFFSLEPVAMTKQFFGRNDLVHVVMLPTNPEHEYIFVSFLEMLEYLGRKEATEGLRSTIWLDQCWFIASVQKRTLCHLEQIALDYAHTVSSECYSFENASSHRIELFPYHGNQFRSLCPIA